MKVLLVNPRQPPSNFTCSEVADITGSRGYIPNIALPTLAALAPDDVELAIVDEEIEPIDFDARCDLVGITGYITQRERMFAIADEFRRRGRIVAIGGPYATLSQSSVRPHADILFIGEAEQTWPEFLRDFRQGSWKREYRQVERVLLESSPPPRVDRLKSGAYWVGVVQTSRGCPFECEFCDVIVYLGRSQRYKAPGRVVAEVEQFYQDGYRSVLLSDDNFTANRKYAAEILQALAAWNAAKPEPVSFTTQLSIDAAHKADLLDHCRAAGLNQAFVGIETPNEAALREVRKNQNLRHDLIRDIHQFHTRGILIMAGIVNGFDAHTLDTFAQHYRFVQQAGLPVVNVTMLHAPEGTPLERRLRLEGRLRTRQVGDYAFDTNIVPKCMTHQQLHAGTKWLLNRLYRPQAFLRRVERFAAQLPPQGEGPSVNERAARVLFNLMRAYKQLGPEFAAVPALAVECFRGRETTTLVTILVFFAQVVRVMRKRGLWDGPLGELENPSDFLAAARPSLSGV